MLRSRGIAPLSLSFVTRKRCVGNFTYRSLYFQGKRSGNPVYKRLGEYQKRPEDVRGEDNFLSPPEIKHRFVRLTAVG
jgi:hypothetical protein